MLDRKVFIAIPKGKTVKEDIELQREIFEWCQRRNNVLDYSLILCNEISVSGGLNERCLVRNCDWFVTVGNSKRDKYCEIMLRLAKRFKKQVSYYGA